MKRVLSILTLLIGLAVVQSADAMSLRMVPFQPFVWTGYASTGFGIGFDGNEQQVFSVPTELQADFNTTISPLLRYKLDFRMYVGQLDAEGFYLAPYLTIGGTKAQNNGNVKQTVAAGGTGIAPGYSVNMAGGKVSLDSQLAFGYAGILNVQDNRVEGTVMEVRDAGFMFIPSLALGFHF